MNYWSKELYIIEDQNFRRTRVRLCNREKLEGLSFRQRSIYCWGGRGYPFFWSYDGWYFLSPAVSLESQDTVIWTAMDMKYCGYF